MFQLRVFIWHIKHYFWKSKHAGHLNTRFVYRYMEISIALSFSNIHVSTIFHNDPTKNKERKKIGSTVPLKHVLFYTKKRHTSTWSKHHIPLQESIRGWRRCNISQPCKRRAGPLPAAASNSLTRVFHSPHARPPLASRALHSPFACRARAKKHIEFRILCDELNSAYQIIAEWSVSHQRAEARAWKACSVTWWPYYITEWSVSHQRADARAKKACSVTWWPYYIFLASLLIFQQNNAKGICI